MYIVIMYYSLIEFHISSKTTVLLLLYLYTSPGGGCFILYYLYYNNICHVIVNGVSLLKELLIFQMYGHVDLKTFGVRVVSYIRYI